MADEEDNVRTVRPVMFLNDPRIPVDGVKDYSPRMEPAQPVQTPNRDPESSVYGGQRVPTSEEPVVMDRKAPVGAATHGETGVGDAGGDPGQDPQDPKQEAKQSEQEEEPAVTSTEGTPLPDDDDDTGETTTPEKPAQTPTPQTSEPTQAEVESSPQKQSSRSTGSSSRKSQSQKGKSTRNKE